MKDKKQKISQLKIKLKELNSIVEKRFKTSKELQKHVEKNKKTYEEANNLFKQIEQLEWELLSPEEKKKVEKGERFLALKAKGEPFDLDEFSDLNE